MIDRPDNRGGPAARPLSGAASNPHEGRSRPLSSVREFGELSRRERHDPDRQLRGYGRGPNRARLNSAEIRIFSRGLEKFSEAMRRAQFSLVDFNRAMSIDPLKDVRADARNRERSL